MKKLGLFFPLIALVLVSCLSVRHQSIYPLPGGYSYFVPRTLDDGLATGSIEGTLFDADRMLKLNAFFAKLKQGVFGEIHSVLMVHKGVLVLEEYFPGFRFKGGKTDFTASDLHHLASVTKSITSLCVGIALDKGYIKSIDQPFLDFYPGVPMPDREKKQDITIRHLLTMTAGMEWDESTYPYTDLRNDVVQFYISRDPLRFLLDRKAVAPPGSRWIYSGAYPNLLGDIVHRSSGYTLDKFAAEFLYKPLGITAYSWITLNKGFIYASGDAELRPRDMAKIGQLVLNGGVWNGRSVISRKWLELSMQAAAQANPRNMYGFMWWLPILPGSAAESLGPLYMASGWGDQYIVIVPKLDLVLVITGGNYESTAAGTVPILNYMLDTLFLPH